MGLLDNDDGMSMGMGLLSPQDKLMSLFQGLTQAGATMAQPGMSGWSGFAQGLGGFGQGMQRGNQQAMQQRMMLEKFGQAQKQRKYVEEAIAGLPPEQQALARANPTEFLKTKIDRIMPKPAGLPTLGATRTIKKGDREITETFDGANWASAGEAPRWQPHQPPQPHKPNEMESLLLASGLKPGTPEYRQAAQSILAGKTKEGAGFGNGLDARAMEVLLDKAADPASERYAMAYWHMTQPKPMEVVREDGSKAVNWQVPTLPPNIRRPAYAQQPAAAPTPDGAPAPAAQAAPGMPTLMPAGPTQPPKMNDEQSKAALYADRMRAAENVIAKVGEAGLSIKDRVASRVPGAGNFLVSNEYQQLDQAQRDFINATLRRESGAVISDQEFDNARKQYFPQPGDSKETLAQKRRNRQLATEGIGRAAGPGYKPKTDYSGMTDQEAIDAAKPPPGFTVIN